MGSWAYLHGFLHKTIQQCKWSRFAHVYLPLQRSDLILRSCQSVPVGRGFEGRIAAFGQFSVSALSDSYKLASATNYGSHSNITENESGVREPETKCHPESEFWIIRMVTSWNKYMMSETFSVTEFQGKASLTGTHQFPLPVLRLKSH